MTLEEILVGAIDEGANNIYIYPPVKGVLFGLIRSSIPATVGIRVDGKIREFAEISIKEHQEIKEVLKSKVESISGLDEGIPLKGSYMFEYDDSIYTSEIKTFPSSKKNPTITFSITKKK